MTELEDLRARLAEAEEALRAIRSGHVDGVLVTGERGEHVYTLRGADRIYRQLIETMSEGAVVLAADGHILYCNARLAEMLGLPLDRVLGTAFRDYMPPADRQAVDAILNQARTESSRQEINLKSGDDQFVPVYLSASRPPNDQAELGFCLVLTDLREQRSHEKVVGAERLGRLILEQAAEAIIVCDAQGRIIRAGQAAQQLCDCDPLQRPLIEVFPLRTNASEPFDLAPVLRGATLTNTDVALDRHGRELALILNAGPLVSGPQILGCVVTLTDITERERADEALRASQQLIERILNAIPVRVFWKDRSLTYLGCNAVFARDAGFADPKDIVGKDDYQLVWRDRADLYRGDDRQVIQSGSAKIYIEEPLTTPDGKTATILTSKVPLYGPRGEVSGVLGTYVDITERRLAEDRIKNQLVELTRWQDVMLGREERVQELKREVNELCRRAGENPRYQSQHAAPSDPEAVEGKP